MSDETQPVLGCTTRPYNTCEIGEAMERIAAAGYTDVALFRMQGKTVLDADTSPGDVAALRRAAADAGVTPSMVIGTAGLDCGLECALDRYKRLIHGVAEVGAQWLLDCGTGNAAQYDDYCDLMRRAAAAAENAGIRITLKPHGGISTTAADLIRVHRTVNHPAFGICYDPGNVIYYTAGERRPEDDVDEVASAVSVAIIKDCILRGEGDEVKPDVQVTPGDGLVDFPRVLARLGAAGFAGPLYVECVGSSDPDAVDRDIAFTLGYIRGILQGLDHAKH